MNKLLILLLFFCSCTAEKSNSKTEPSQSVTSPVILQDPAGEWTLGFSSPKSTKKLPLIVYLHGGVGTSRTDKGKTAYEMFSFLNDSNEFRLVSPSGNRNAPWWSRTGMERIYRSVSFMTDNFAIDTSKIFLAGVSDGATALFAVAAQPSHPFAGFIGAAGYPLLFKDQLSPSDLKQVPIHMYVSEKDRLYPHNQITAYYTELKSAGVPISFKLYEDAEHGFEYRTNEKAFIKELLKKWHL